MKIWQRNALINFGLYAVDMSIATAGFVVGFGLEIQNWWAMIGLMLVSRWIFHTVHMAMLSADKAKDAATRDHCEICAGTRGGVPGNENIVESCGEKVTMCDYCHADEMRRPGFWKEGPRMGEEESR